MHLAASRPARHLCPSRRKAQPRSPGPPPMLPGTPPAPWSPNISFNYFKIRSWQTNPAGDPSQTGKCLDYGISPTGNAGVFLNDCSAAHLVRVMELPELAYPPDGHTCQYQDAQVPPNCFHHEVLLYAGKSVLGLNIPQTISQGGTSGSSQPATEY